jgi:LuxR family transcriptional regulator, transcriptional regulator of spore coat protein
MRNVSIDPTLNRPGQALSTWTLFTSGFGEASMLNDTIMEAGLTARETQVLEEVALGFSAKEVAAKLLIAPATVERHIENARLKTRTRNRTHMIAYTLHRGMLPKFRASKPE